MGLRCQVMRDYGAMMMGPSRSTFGRRRQLLPVGGVYLDMLAHTGRTHLRSQTFDRNPPAKDRPQQGHIHENGEYRPSSEPDDLEKNGEHSPAGYQP